MPARRALLRTAAATGVALAALLTAGPVAAHDHATTQDHTTSHDHSTTQDHTTSHDHATTQDQPTSHDHSTRSPSAGSTAPAHGDDHGHGDDHDHGTGTVPVEDGPSDGSRALVLGGFAVANIVVVAGAALTRVAAPPRHLPRNRRS